jgi:proteic killer suppression protein
MIQTFADKSTAALFTGLHVRRLPAAIQIRARAKLLAIHAATTLDDLRIPTSNHLELLRGDRATQYSVRINNQWRICFTWREGNAYDVEIVDYH